MFYAITCYIQYSIVINSSISLFQVVITVRPITLVMGKAVLVVRKACTRRPNYKVTSAPPSRLSYGNKNVFSDRRQCQCQAVAVPVASCSRSGGRQRGNSGRQNGYGSSERCMCPRRPNVDGGETCQRKPRSNRQQGKTGPSRATTYKLTRL